MTTYSTPSTFAKHSSLRKQVRFFELQTAQTLEDPTKAHPTKAQTPHSLHKWISRIQVRAKLPQFHEFWYTPHHQCWLHSEHDCGCVCEAS